MLLKRVIALEGETVAFQKGQAYINQQELSEPYLSEPWDWTLEPRAIKPGEIFVVGDNRNTPMKNHSFGAVTKQRIQGKPLW